MARKKPKPSFRKTQLKSQSVAEDPLPGELIEVREWRDKYVADASHHPVIAALASAVGLRIEIFLRWSSQGIGTPNWFSEGPEAVRNLAELRELAPWLPEPGMPKNKRDRMRMIGRLMTEAGASWDTTDEVLNAGFRKAGAPATARHRAVIGLEMRLAAKNWKEIGQVLCPIAHVHNRQCAEPIRREILRLQQILQKYRPDVLSKKLVSEV